MAEISGQFVDELSLSLLFQNFVNEKIDSIESCNNRTDVELSRLGISNIGDRVRFKKKIKQAALRILKKSRLTRMLGLDLVEKLFNSSSPRPFLQGMRKGLYALGILQSWKRFNECSEMTHINNSFEIPNNDTYWPNSSEQSLLNGGQDQSHPHPDHYLEFNFMYDYLDYFINNTFFYQSYDFEAIMYISFWALLVILTAVANVLIVAVFVRKSLRTPNNIILLFIAISDSLTGLVTLPTYLYVFTIFTHGIFSLNERWCKAFIISTFYISKAFHTISIWQTLLLGFQRFCCIWFPFKTNSWFTTRRTLIDIAVITISAFVIHSYHLTKLKGNNIVCEWVIEHPCVETCIFLWIILLLIHILPSGFLLVLTILIIYKLFNRPIRKENFSAEQSRERDQQNKRASIIVVCITIIVLIPEIPYGIFLLVTVIKRHSSNYILPLEANRLFHVIYAMAMLLSFHANFWVYIIMNRRFRDELKSMSLDIKRKLQPKCTTDPLADVSMEMSRVNPIAQRMEK